MGYVARLRHDTWILKRSQETWGKRESLSGWIILMYIQEVGWGCVMDWFWFKIRSSCVDYCEHGKVSGSMVGEECVWVWLGSIKFSVPISYVTGLSVSFRFQDRIIRHRTQQRAARASTEHDPRNLRHCTDFFMRAMRSVHRCTLVDEARRSSALAAPLLVRCETVTAKRTCLRVDNTAGY